MRRRLPALVGPLGRLRPLPRGGPRRRRPALDPPDRVPRRAAQGGGGDVRRPDLREGLRRPAHARAVHRRRRLPRRRAHVPEGARLRQHRDRATCGTHSKTPAAHRFATSWTRSSSRAATRSSRCTATRSASSPSASARSPRRHVVHRVGVAGAGGRPGAARWPSSPARPSRHLVLDAEPARDPGGRAGAGRGQRRRLGHVPRRLRGGAPAGAGRARWPSSRPSSGPTCSPTPGPRPWPGSPGLEEFLVLASRLGLEPDPAPWAPVGAALRPDQRGSRGTSDQDALHARGRRARSAPPPTGSASTPRRARASAPRSLRALAINLHGHGGRRTRRSGPRRRGASTPRRSAAARATRSRPTSRSATLAVVAQLRATGRLRRAAGALPDRRDTPGGDALARRARRSSPTSTCACARSTWP